MNGRAAGVGESFPQFGMIYVDPESSVDHMPVVNQFIW